MGARSPELLIRRHWLRCAYLDPQLPGDLAEKLWRAPESLLESGELLRKVGARSTVRFDWTGQSFVLKHYVEPTLRHSLKQNVSPSRARTTWLTAHRLADTGIATPRPVACIENRFGPFRGDSFLMYPYVEGQTLKSLLVREESTMPTFIQQMREQLVEFWKRLQQARISLGDTNLKNFIVGDAGRLWVIDVDKVRFHRLSYVAARRHERGWTQMARSAQRTGGLAKSLVEGLRERL